MIVQRTEMIDMCDTNRAFPHHFLSTVHCLVSEVEKNLSTKLLPVNMSK